MQAHVDNNFLRKFKFAAKLVSNLIVYLDTRGHRFVIVSRD